MTASGVDRGEDLQNLRLRDSPDRATPLRRSHQGAEEDFPALRRRLTASCADGSMDLDPPEGLAAGRLYAHVSGIVKTTGDGPVEVYSM